MRSAARVTVGVAHSARQAGERHTLLHGQLILRLAQIRFRLDDDADGGPLLPAFDLGTHERFELLKVDQLVPASTNTNEQSRARAQHMTLTLTLRLSGSRAGSRASRSQHAGGNAPVLVSLVHHGLQLLGGQRDARLLHRRLHLSRVNLAISICVNLREICCRTLIQNLGVVHAIAQLLHHKFAGARPGFFCDRSTR
jgi:hypothetical protein